MLHPTMYILIANTVYSCLGTAPTVLYAWLHLPELFPHPYTAYVIPTVTGFKNSDDKGGASAIGAQ